MDWYAVYKWIYLGGLIGFGLLCTFGPVIVEVLPTRKGTKS